jgi:hypothetical protein
MIHHTSYFIARSDLSNPGITVTNPGRGDGKPRNLVAGREQRVRQWDFVEYLGDDDNTRIRRLVCFIRSRLLVGVGDSSSVDPNHDDDEYMVGLIPCVSFDMSHTNVKFPYPCHKYQWPPLYDYIPLARIIIDVKVAPARSSELSPCFKSTVDCSDLFYIVPVVRVPGDVVADDPCGYMLPSSHADRLIEAYGLMTSRRKINLGGADAPNANTVVSSSMEIES